MLRILDEPDPELELGESRFLARPPTTPPTPAVSAAVVKVWPSVLAGLAADAVVLVEAVVVGAAVVVVEEVAVDAVDPVDDLPRVELAVVADPELRDESR